MRSFIILSLMIFSLLMVFASAGTSQVEGLVAYYRFDGGSNADDLSGNKHHGKLVGGAEFVKNDGAPVPGGKGCVKFVHKPGNAVDCGESPDLRIVDNLTLMAWAKPDEANSTQYVAGTPYDDKAAWDAPWVGHQIGVRGGRMATWLNIKAVDREYDAGAVKAGEWTHLTFTFSGKAALSYVNGGEVANQPDRQGKIEFDGKPHFMIGERSEIALGEPFGGMIDEVALFNRVLTPDEIKAFMKDGIPLAVESSGKLTTTWGNLKRP
jgi:hypothetical protein